MVPILDWISAIIGSVGLAVPFWICWTWLELGKKYGTFLPDQFQSIPFWDCIGLAIVIGCLQVLSPFRVSQKVTQKGK